MRKLFRRKAIAENNRFIGLATPTNEDLAEIVLSLVGPRLLSLWDQDDEKEDAKAVYRP